MRRWIISTCGRMLPAGIPIAFVMILAVVVYLQNRTTLTYHGHFIVVDDDEMAVSHKSYHAGDNDPDAEGEEALKSVQSPPVAKKLVLTRRGGLRFFDRGHDVLFTAEIPEFLDHSPFFQDLGQRLRREAIQAAKEFVIIDWSLVTEGFQEQNYAFLGWTGQITIEIVHLTPGAVSLVLAHWEYTGGAHGNGALTGRSFIHDQGCARELKLADLFKPESDWERRLVEVCVSDLRCQEASLISDMSVENQDPESATFSIDDLSQFSLSPAGIRFYFSPYHVGTYAEGIYTVLVPYYMLNDCLNVDGPLRLFMSK